MIDFKIKRGLSTTMFISPGVINPRLIIEEGYWYLCTDTAELFLGVKTGEETYTLKRINGAITPSVGPDVPDEDPSNLKFIVEELQEKVAILEDIELFQKINNEADLPNNFDSDEFNPNITYYMHSRETGILSTYIYDNDTQSYLCSTNKGATGLGISKVEINSDGELVVEYTNGTADIVGKVVGTDGLTTSIRVGDKLYTQTNGVIELPAFATQEYVENYVRDAIAQAELGGTNVDLSDYVTKDLLEDYATKEYVTDTFTGVLDAVVLHGGDATPENPND